MKKVFVSGCYDLLHSGHVEFFRQASQYGELYVGIGSDSTILEYKHHKTFYPEQERLFMVKSIRYVKDAFINAGSGIMDFVPTVEFLHPDVFVVNEDGSSDTKRKFCEEHGIEYVVLERTPAEGLTARSSTDIKNGTCALPTRLDLAGTWIDQPYVSCYAPGWAITMSLIPTFEVRERCGLSTSTRNMIKKIWPVKLPDMDPEILSKLVFCFENDPERNDGIVSGAQDAIGICILVCAVITTTTVSGPRSLSVAMMSRYFPAGGTSLHDSDGAPSTSGCSVVEGKDITEVKVKALAQAADDCWQAIMAKDYEAFARAYKASFDAQVSMFPAMIQGCVQGYIDKYSALPDVKAWKMPWSRWRWISGLSGRRCEEICRGSS